MARSTNYQQIPRLSELKVQTMYNFIIMELKKVIFNASMSLADQQELAAEIMLDFINQK
jgi:hypothetical protein